MSDSKHEIVKREQVNLGRLLGTTIVITCSCGKMVNVNDWASHATEARSDRAFVVEYVGSDPLLQGERLVVPEGLTLFGLNRFVKDQILGEFLPIEWAICRD